MSSSRLESLKEMSARDPASAFLRYALAQELANAGRLEEACAEFARLIEQNADYPPAYFHGGKTLEKLGRTADARDYYRRGVTAAGRAGDMHAQAEMQAALDLLGT